MDMQEKEDGRLNDPPDIVSRANEGDSTAQLLLGKAYFDATLVENNHHMTIKWIHRSAEQGNMKAQFKLGDLYALENGVSKHFADAYKWYTKAAIQGYKKALIRLHNLYQGELKMHCHGKINSGENKDSAEDRIQERKKVSNSAIDYYSQQFNHYQSSNQEDPIVQLNLAFLYQHGYGVKRCTRWAFEYYTLAAEQGNVDAQYNPGNLYQKHIDIKFNYRQAFRWLTESAQGGSIAAQKSLAYFYLKGLATDMDVLTALLWYTKAAEAGDSAAQVILGKLYRKGECIKQDLPMAVKWYTLAARQGNIVAQNCLTQLHQRGMLDNIGLDEDVSEYFTKESMNGRICTKLSAEVSRLDDSPRFKQLRKLVKYALIGDGQAMHEIGLKYLKGDNGFTQDQETGIKWIKNAANAKHKGARLMIADLYKEGNLIEQDYCKATIWYKTVAKQKDSEAQCNVGVMYNKGLGVREDPLEASKWFTWAADQGNSDGQYNLGMLRFGGRGIRQDKEEAMNLFLKSAYQRNVQACYKLSESYFRGLYHVEKNTKSRLTLLEYAANNGIEDAQVTLGDMYKSESEANYDLSKSTLYYTMAADSGNWFGQSQLVNMYLDGNDTDSIKMFNFFKKGRDRGYIHFNKLFESLERSLLLIDYSGVCNMFIEATKKGLDNLHYNIGSCYEHGFKRYGEYVIDINYVNAIKWYLAASENDDSRADYRLGIMHEYGKHFESDMDTAIGYYNKAFLQGNSDAIYRLGCIYVNGYGITQDLLKAYHLFSEASSMGNKDAHIELKIERFHNIGPYGPPRVSKVNPKIPVSKATRISMLEKATEKGFTGLQYQLGIYYERANNYAKAFKWFSHAAEIGVTDAYFRLGTLYEEGRGVEQDYTVAAKMYKKATEKEHEDACYRLGRLYQYGNGIELDYLKSYYFYKKAADMGHVKASKLLNISLDTRLTSDEDTKLSAQEHQDSLLMCKRVAEYGDTEVQFQVGFAYEHIVSEPNYVEAYKWYSMASKSSHKKGLYHLGLLYEKGLGVSQNYDKALQLYKQADQQSNDDALYRLGVAYHYGKGVEVDTKKAVEYYTRAAEQGKPEYQCELGKLYEEGELVEKNLLVSLKWYTIAYLQGYDVIRSRLSTMYEQKPYEDFFYKKLLHNLSMASCGHFRLNNGYSYDEYAEINNRIGSLYFFGHGVDKDIRKAWKYFYFPEKYDEAPDVKNEMLLFLRSDTLRSSEKNDILNAIEQDEAIVGRMNVRQRYMLGMLFFHGLQKTEDGYSSPFLPYLEDFSQNIIIEKNYMKAFKYLEMAADKNYRDALLQLGIMYHCGYGVEKSIEQGEKCFDSSVMSDIDYMIRIATLYHAQSEMQNFDKALELYTRLEKTLDEDLDKSRYIRIGRRVDFGMGLLHEFGDGVKQSYPKAMEYYKKFSNYIVTECNHRQALMYYYGKGIPVDYNKAFDLFRKCLLENTRHDELPYVHYQIGSDTNIPQTSRVYRIIHTSELLADSFYYFGLMHKYGQGVLKDEEIARGYFQEAAKRGCKRAKCEL